MEIPEQLTMWDFPDTYDVPAGYDYKTQLRVTEDNFAVLVNEHNKLVAVIEKLCEHTNVRLEDLD